MVLSKDTVKLRNDTADVLKKLGYDVDTNVRLVGPRGGMTKVDMIAESANGRYAF